ncbi:MAGa4850 family ICE element protein [[Mycoplasma] anseris]|uniref:Uncharacterized protein n=2 Tax=[Mycoplasma] anseris TaxID=92400 RepID=A0A2Z4NDA6_9BACT|nr:hypothetical protein [[Mycoplasma] anseris]AWX69550.1 hypothetical protein DP065_02180 [[Mycoplasma] anseris]
MRVKENLLNNAYITKTDYKKEQLNFNFHYLYKNKHYKKLSIYAIDELMKNRFEISFETIALFKNKDAAFLVLMVLKALHSKTGTKTFTFKELQTYGITKRKWTFVCEFLKQHGYIKLNGRSWYFGNLDLLGSSKHYITLQGKRKWYMLLLFNLEAVVNMCKLQYLSKRNHLLKIKDYQKLRVSNKLLGYTYNQKAIKFIKTLLMLYVLPLYKNIVVSKAQYIKKNLFKRHRYIIAKL